MLAGRRVLLGISGGVAAYKAAYLARRFIEAGAELEVILTDAAQQFVGQQTLAAIAGRPVHTNLFDGLTPSPHTDLARWAEIIVVAPATANFLARAAIGGGNDLLSATLLASKAPRLFAPAMHTEMWEQPATRRNTAQLLADGVHLVGPDEGALTSGDHGHGRMVEPDEILSEVIRILGPGDMDGLTVLVTAGGTREPIDPVRYIGNRSSGKMGNAIALDAARRGARVWLITSVSAPVHENISVITVESAEEMAEATWASLEGLDVAVMAAAVADFRPGKKSEAKMDRSSGPPTLAMEPTPDVLAGVAERSPETYLVGFAAEVGSLDRAIDKAKRKKVDLLVANDVSRPDSGFGADTNQVMLVTPDGQQDVWPTLTKAEVAHRLWDTVLERR